MDSNENELNRVRWGQTAGFLTPLEERLCLWRVGLGGRFDAIMIPNAYVLL